ncbi:MAG: hypothetical protein JWM33_2134 [Caulobacteraceae bacterium]|nr:hypothetical protein [Caulobacteraceae bacterium]
MAKQTDRATMNSKRSAPPSAPSSQGLPSLRTQRLAPDPVASPAVPPGDTRTSWIQRNLAPVVAAAYGARDSESGPYGLIHALARLGVESNPVNLYLDKQFPGSMPGPSDQLDTFKGSAATGFLLGGKNELMSLPTAAESWATGQGFKAPYSAEIQRRDARDHELRSRYPVTSAAGMATGGVLGAMAIPATGGETLAGRVGLGMAANGATGAASAFLGTDGSLRDRAGAAVKGGLLGTTLGAAGGAMAARGGGESGELARALLQREGVETTIGDHLGGLARDAEGGMASNPFIGPAIREARERSQSDFTRAAVNRAIAPFGEDLPKGVTGHDAIAHAQKIVQTGFDNAYRGVAVQPDAALQVQIGEIGQRLSALPGRVDQDFAAVLANRLKPGPDGRISGYALQSADKDLGQLSAVYGADPSADRQLLGKALGDAQGALRDLIERGGGARAGTMQSARQGEAHLNLAEAAASQPATNGRGGVFTPAEYGAAVRASSSRSQAAARQAPGQDLAAAGQMILSPVGEGGSKAGVRATVTGLSQAPLISLYSPLAQAVARRSADLLQDTRTLPGRMAGAKSATSEQRPPR